MKVITRTILIFAAIGGVISGCATKSEFKDLKERMDVLESNKIQSIEGQISSIDTSIGLLDQTDDQLEGYINALKEQVLELEVTEGEGREALEAAIKALQAEDESLHKQMEELKSYVDTELNGVKDWASATFVTLEEYNKTVDVITGIQAKVDSLQVDIAKEYEAAINEAIEKTAKSMESWVNEQLTGYYDIATMNTKLDSLKSALEKQIKEQGGEMEEQIAQNTENIEALESELEKTAEDITDAYEEAIKDAIEENNGTITQIIQKAIDGVNTKIKGLDERVTELETAVKKLEERMDEAERTLKNLASITYIPKYSDGIERVLYNIVAGGNFEAKDLTLRFDVHPSNCADSIVTAYGKNNSILSARAVYTLTKASAGEFVNLGIKGVTAANGVLTVTVSPEKLDNDFLSSNLEAAVVLKINTGYSNIQSDYIGLVPAIIDLSASESANCYLVQAAGVYKFRAVKGNTFKKDDSNKTGTSVGTVASVDVLWESFGTAEAPKKGDIISSVSYSSDGYIQFFTPDNFAEGNAVIAAKDKDGVILWSWHIWCAKEGWKEQMYNNNAGTMMDRNLGATSATPGDVGSVGLLYQWGRKDPFLGSSSVNSATKTASTGTWSISNESVTENSIKNPTTFYTGESNCMSNDSWSRTKTVNDPCPAGWRVPDGGVNGIWSTAKGSSDEFSITKGSYGLNFGGVFGSAETIWYPSSGYLYFTDGGLRNLIFFGYYWSVTPDPSNSYNAYCFLFYSGIDSDGAVSPSFSYSRSAGMAVRCLQEY